jgi:hypothetical protein
MSMGFFDPWNGGREKGPLGVNNRDGSRWTVWGNPGSEGFNSTMTAHIEAPGHPTRYSEAARACPEFMRAVEAWRQEHRR